MTPWLRYLIAFVVGCHGFIYMRWGAQAPSTLKEWTGISWLLGGAVTGDGLQALVSALYVIAGIMTLASAVAIGFAPSLPRWWRPLAIGGAAAGIVGFAVFFDGQTQLMVGEGAIGAGVSLIIFVSAIAFAGAFATAQSQGV